MTNYNCDGQTATSCRDGEVRVLPLGTHGNLIVCRSCFDIEIKYRKIRNAELSPDCRWDLPTWNSLKIYNTEE